MNITEYDNSLDFAVALEVAPFFRLKQQEAEKCLKEIIDVTENWRNYASAKGISRSEQEEM